VMHLSAFKVVRVLTWGECIRQTECALHDPSVPLGSPCLTPVEVRGLSSTDPEHGRIFSVYTVPILDNIEL
jgi:hypothetical protein